MISLGSCLTRSDWHFLRDSWGSIRGKEHFLTRVCSVGLVWLRWWPICRRLALIQAILLLALIRRALGAGWDLERAWRGERI